MCVTGNTTFSGVSAGFFSTTGNITAGNVVGGVFIGDGTGLTGISAGNALGNIISFGSSNVAIPVISGNVRVTVGGVANVGVFTSTGLEVTSNISAGNLSLTTELLSQSANVSGNINVGNVITLGTISSAGNITSANLITTGFMLALGNVNGANLTSTGLVSAAGNVIAGNINGGANVNATTLTGNTVSVIGNINGANITASANISAAGNIVGVVFSGAAVSVSDNISSNNISLTTNVSAGGNITAASVSTTGNISSANTVVGGNVVALANFQTVSLSATGNATINGNIIGGGSITVPGNIDSGNINTFGISSTDIVVVGPISAAGNVSGSYFVGNGALLSGITTGATLASRSNVTVATGNIGNGVVTNTTFNAYPGYAMYKITTNAASWVRVYTSTSARTADATRTIDTDPQPGAGVIAEAITLGANIVVLSPAALGWNDENPVSNVIPIAITNTSGTTRSIAVTFTVVQLEV